MVELSAVGCVFYEGNKQYLQVLLDEYLYKLWMLEYDRIDIFEWIDINQTSDSCECIIWYYWYFLKINFRLQSNLCDGCHDLTQKLWV